MLLSSKGQSASAPKRALPALAATVLKNPKVQEAVIDKGLEVMNKLVDKQLRIIDEAQEKASNFLAKEVRSILIRCRCEELKHRLTCEKRF